MANPTQIDYGALGKRRFDNFCRTVDKLISNNNNPIDLLVAAGNSGVALAAFTELIYEMKGLSIPPKLSVPLYRYLPGHQDDPVYHFDMSVLLGTVREQVASIPSAHNALFVDDEIYHGFTALSVLGLINQALTRSGRQKLEQYIIVAEDQGFEVPLNYAGVKFIPYDYELEELSNVIFFFTPSEFENPIIKVLGDDTMLPFHCRTNVLLGVPVKEFNGGQPRFTNRYIEIVQEEVPNFSELQERYKIFLKEEIKRCLLL